MAESLKTLDGAEGPSLYVMAPPVSLLKDGGIVSAFAIPVLRRREGVLMALPLDFLIEEVLEAGRTAHPADLVGPSIEITCFGVEEETDGTETALGVELKVLLVDFNIAVSDFLKEFSGREEDFPNLPFFAESPTVLPSSTSLLSQALEWISTGEVLPERVQFYSADEVPQSTAPEPPVKAKSKAAPKKVTTAQLAEQFAVFAQALPAIQQRLDALQNQQTRIASQPPQFAPQSREAPPHRQPFPKAAGMSLPADVKSFMAAVGTPPRTRVPMSPPQLGGQETILEEPQLIPSEEGYLDALHPRPQVDVSTAILHQGQALTALVSHLIGQDGLTDLSSSSSSGLSTKGSVKREKLRQELAARSGNFLLQVAQNAYRRLKPADEIPKDFQGFKGKSVLSKYLEKQGGFQGHRDLGLMAWLLAQIGDQMIIGDHKGAAELLALAMVGLEQCAQDGGRWELAWILTLQEDPPGGLFQTKHQATNPRIRAFAPLCPAPWATTALSYVKELDLITSRRLETLPGKKPSGSEKGGESSDSSPKKKVRFPKKPKATEQNA